MTPTKADEKDGLFKITSYDSYEEEHQNVLHDDERSSDYGSDTDDDDNNVCVVPVGGKMRSMSVAFGEEFTDEHEKRCGGKYWFCIVCSIVLGLILIITADGLAEYQKQFQMLHEEFKEDDDSYCQYVTEDTIQVLMNHFNTIDDESKFCQEDAAQCSCKNPFAAQKPTIHEAQWDEIFQLNLNTVDKWKKRLPDVVMLGDSITEHWNGLDLGYSSPAWKKINNVFGHIFARETGGKVNGVALGIGGDRIQNLLYRLQNGEANPKLHPRVWWILVGANDLEDSCSADAIAAGNFRIAQEIRKKHPTAVIVFNSMLPRNDSPRGLSQSPTWGLIQQVNQRLDCYAKATDGVEFFNATGIFTTRKNQEYFVRDGYMADAVHPNAEGSGQWGDMIANRVVAIRYKLRKAHKPID